MVWGIREEERKGYGGVKRMEIREHNETHHVLLEKGEGTGI
jgi:hypothetical protein